MAGRVLVDNQRDGVQRACAAPPAPWFVLTSPPARPGRRRRGPRRQDIPCLLGNRSKVLAIRSWIGSSLAMVRGGFLSAKERTALQAVMRHPSETHGVARRANAILLLDDGWNCAKVAEALYLDDDTVRTWFKRYQAGGLDEMTVFDWKGRSGDLSRERMAGLSARLGERLMRDSGEVAAYIAARWGVVYSPSGCVALLHRLGFEDKRPESLPACSDEARQAAFISRYDQLLNGLAADEVVYFADAVHPEYQSRPAHGWVRTGNKVALRRTSGRQRPQPPRGAQPGEVPLPSGRGRADRCRLHPRAAREVGGQQPRQEADLRHRRQRPLSSRPCGPAVAGETRLPHHARLPARPCTPSQRHREVMGCHAPRSDPQQVPCELQPLRRSHLRFLSPTIATRVNKMVRTTVGSVFFRSRPA